jgi:predicted transcriptional regulator
MQRLSRRGTVISTRVAASIVDRLEQLASDSDRTLAAEIRRAIHEHILAADHEQEQE